MSTALDALPVSSTCRQESPEVVSQSPRRVILPTPTSLRERYELPNGMYFAISRRSGLVSIHGDFRVQFPEVEPSRPALVTGLDARDEAAMREGVERATALRQEHANKYTTARANQAISKLPWNPRLGPMAHYHLRAKASSGRFAKATLAREAGVLGAWIRYYENGKLSGVTVASLQRMIEERREMPGLIPGTLVAWNTILNELYALSNMFEHAIRLGVVFKNPVDQLPNKPTRWLPEAAVLTQPEVARLLDAAAEEDAAVRSARAVVAAHDAAYARGQHTCKPLRDLARRVDCMEAILTTLFYTGGRLAEVLGLDLKDLDFSTDVVRFRHNKHRKLKRAWHVRDVPMWGPLRIALQRHLRDTGTSAGLVFPTKNGKMRRDIAKAYARCLKRAGLRDADRETRVTRHTLRHSYASCMLQTAVRDQQGNLVRRSSRDVAVLLGHRDSRLVDDRYGHVLHGAPCTEELTVEPFRRLTAARVVAGERPQPPRRENAVRYRGLTLVA